MRVMHSLSPSNFAVSFISSGRHFVLGSFSSGSLFVVERIILYHNFKDANGHKKIRNL